MPRRAIPPPDVRLVPASQREPAASGLMQRDWYDFFRDTLRPAIVTLTYATASPVPINAAAGDDFVLTATNGLNFFFDAPTNPLVGQHMTITIRNASGGALGAADPFSNSPVWKRAAWTQPANGFSRSITFAFNGVNWVERSRTTVDVPN